MSKFSLLALVTWTLLSHLTTGAPVESSADSPIPQMAAPYSRHHRRHQSGLPPTGPFLNQHFNPDLFSNRVMFSPHKPFVPPFLEAMERDFEPEQVELLQKIAQEDVPNLPHKTGISEGDDVTDHSKSRNKRSVPPAISNTSVMPVCASNSQWVQKTSAQDMYGNTLTVLQEIDVGGSRVNQYFFESRCRNTTVTPGTVNPCTGIDSILFASMCMQKYVWVYAKVMDSFGQTGWTLVKNHGSCNCGIVRRAH